MLIDISRKLNKNTPVYSGDPHFSMNEVCTISNEGFSVHNLSFGSHFGTHIDFPRHFFESGKCADDFSPEKTCGNAVIIEINSAAVLNREFFSLQSIEANDIVLLKFTGTPCSLTLDGAEYLAQKQIKMIVTEAMDIEEYEDFRIHRFLLEREILIMEYADLKNAPVGKCRLYALPLNIEGCDASPVRTVIEI
jgi:arylformamidase